jgi:hypothetical protein
VGGDWWVETVVGGGKVLKRLLFSNNKKLLTCENFRPVSIIGGVEVGSEGKGREVMAGLCGERLLVVKK